MADRLSYVQNSRQQKIIIACEKENKVEKVNKGTVNDIE